MTYAPNGDLRDRIREQRENQKYFPENVILRWFAQVVSAVAYLHSSGLVHRDIKPANVFLDENDSALLGDFGIACPIGSTRKNRDRITVGTPMYMAPEIIDGDDGDDKADIWSLGCLLYEMMQLKAPFSSSSLSKLLHYILKNKYRKVYSETYSSELIGTCLLKLRKLSLFACLNYFLCFF